MDIVMLGHSEAGKTTYVSLMYKEMQKRWGVGGFRLRARGRGDGDILLANAKAISGGRYPDASTQRSVYGFVLQHRRSDVFDFSWRDYRGGALRAMSDDRQARELRADLASAAAIVVFSDARRLLTDRAAAAEVKILISNVHRALDARGDLPTPLVIAITKCDLVDYRDDQTRKALQVPFLPIIEAARSTGNVQGAIVPLICGPRPKNVKAPILFALAHAISGRAEQLRNEISRHEAAARQADSLNTFGRWVSDKWNGRKTQGEIAREHRVAALREQAALRPLLDPAEQLKKLLTGLDYF